MRLVRGKQVDIRELLITGKGKRTMMKKYFVGPLLGVWFGVVTASVSAETGNSSPSQGLEKAESLSMFQPLESLTMGTTYMKRREVSINWQQVITTAGFFNQSAEGPSDFDKLRTPGEVIQQLSDELRSRLQGFEDRYDVRVVWKQPGKNCPDVTPEFLKYLRTEQAVLDSCKSNRVEEYKQGLLKIVELSDRLKEKEKSR